MSETMIFPTNYGLVVKDKATAMQYALDKSLYWNSNDGKYDCDFEKAKSIFKLFCDNVNLPDVENGNVVFVPKDKSSASMSCDPNFLVDNDSFIASDDVERIYEQSKKYSGDSENKEETTAKTYDDVARDLFDEKDCFFIDTFANIKICRPSLRNTPHANNCTSRKQAEKLLAINKLLNTARFLNKKWNPNWCDSCEDKWYINIVDNEIKIEINYVSMCGDVYFKTQELAQQAIEILGEDTIRFALSTDW